MNQLAIWVLIIISFSVQSTNSVERETKQRLISFLGNLSINNGQSAPSLNWSIDSDPCKNWQGINCDPRNVSVKKIVLNELNLNGTLDAVSLCNDHSLAPTLGVLSLNNNNISGGVPSELSNCKQLTHLYLSGNRFSGNLPESLSNLKNLKWIDISNNNFSGYLPDFSRISGLSTFLAQNNQLSGKIPKFDFLNFDLFNVSYNNFSSKIPNGGDKFSESSFMGNPELCGKPSTNNCPKSKKVQVYQILMYSGYAVLVLVIVIFIIFRLCRRKKTNKEEKTDSSTSKVAAIDSSSNRASPASAEYKTPYSQSETSTESASMVSSSLIVLTSPVVKGLRFDDLLKAPAEPLGRGKYGSLYKIILEGGVKLAVKRIKDWGISSEEFERRMRRMDQVKHPYVLPALAFYSSKQEKLLVYEYQQNESLLKLLHGSQVAQTFDWASRLNVAARIAEALAFMHHEFHEDGIAHGNLKSSNILLNKNMEPCISEYGLMPMDNENLSAVPILNLNNMAFKAAEQAGNTTFSADIYGFGVILLELLTGKLVQNNGFDLARWVDSVIREEWTAEVFDRNLILEGASEERMVNVLQIAMKCINRSQEARPKINKVAIMINSIKEEEERSIVSEP